MGNRLTFLINFHSYSHLLKLVDTPRALAVGMSRNDRNLAKLHRNLYRRSLAGLPESSSSTRVSVR
jgi:hypothetical protein